MSTTQILARPQGARVFVDGNFVGEAPVSLAEPVLAGMRTRLRVEAPGYRTYVGELVADRWNVGRVVAASVVGALTLGLGLAGLWLAADWAPAYQVLLQPLPGTAVASEPSSIAVPAPPPYRAPEPSGTRP